MPRSERPGKGKEDVAYGSIRGTVIGFIGEKMTRPIYPANVFLLVQVTGEDGKAELYYPADEDKLGRLKKSKVLGIESLQRKHPDVYPPINEAFESFTPVHIDENNNLGRFEFKDIPAGSWGYIAVAYVEDELYMHTDKMGDNGLGKNEVIYGRDILSQEGNILDNVVIPVKDVWIEKVKPAPKVKVKETDKDMDQPSHLKSMLIEDV
ncbi:MAG: hypothetical protein KKD17_06710 [Nanoarchaeota archaeon]|nr:hypothetical protein [Nanoarchaeota archaeon]